ncbi:hypothetical protein KJZ71_04170 [Patescibacteria group bacterium]|jgi:hypothetical protein|nr:hypothetical protein [Patescibacteria group bacterium]MDL1952882.1 hypothetical protein [Candidatus Uhrbacteria bacterium UHB]
MGQPDLYCVMKSLRDHERGIKPDSAWVRANRETLLMQVRNSIPSADVAAKNRILAQTGSRMLKIIRGPVLSFTAILAALLGGSLVSVSAAERSLPGDSLYALKLVTEQARLALTTEQSARMKLKVEFTKRRVEELRTIATTPVSKKDERAAKAAEILKQDLNTLKQQLENAKTSGTTKELADAVKVVEKETVQVVKTLTETKKELGGDVQLTVSDAQASAADIGIQALQALVDVQGSDEGGVTDEGLEASLAAHAEVAKNVAANTMELAAQSEASTASSTTSVTSTSAIALAKNVEAMLFEAQQLLLDGKSAEAIQKIKEASLQSFLAQKQMEGIQQISGDSGMAGITNAAAISTSTSVTGNADVSASSSQETQDASSASGGQ